MADIVDQADAQNEAAVRAALSRRKPAGPSAKAIKHDEHGKAVAWECLSCEAELASEVRWCDSWCREDWDRVQQANRRNGASVE